MRVALLLLALVAASAERAFTTGTARKMWERLYDAAFANAQDVTNATGAATSIPGRELVRALGRNLMRKLEHPPFETVDQNFEKLTAMVRSLARVVEGQQHLIHALSLGQTVVTTRVCRDRDLGDLDATHAIRTATLRRVQDPEIVNKRDDLRRQDQGAI